MTMMNAVKGACVTAARNPAMPMAIKAGAMASPPVSEATLWPIPAPMDREGAKIPPGTPIQADS